MSQDVLTRTEDTPRPDRAADTTTDPDNAQFDLLQGEPLGRDLLKNRFVSAVMRSRWYPGAFQIPIAAVFGLVAHEIPFLPFLETAIQTDSNHRRKIVKI